MSPFQQAIAAILLIALLGANIDCAQGQKTAAPAGTTPHLNASAELQRLLQRDETARQAGDSVGRLKVALQLRTLLNDAGDAVLAAAHAYSVVKDSTKAFEALTTYARLGFAGKAICGGEDKKFSWLAQTPQFSAICRLMEENEHPVNRAIAVIHFPDTGYLAEDIDYDKKSRTFLFTSVLQHSIFNLDHNGNCRLFAPSPSGWPMMAIKIDHRRGLVWATEVLLPGFDGMMDSIKGRSAVCCFELRTGKLKTRINAPEGAQWGDMTLDGQGNPIVSDGQSGDIFRLDKTTWRRLDKGDFISPQTMALTADGQSLIIPDYVRGLAILKIDNGEVSWIRNNPDQPCAFTGVDGVYRQNQRLLITQNGTEPERVVEIQLDKQGKQLTGYTLIESATAGLGDPTHGVLVDGDFYYIANSGWDVLDQHGKLKPGARMSPPTLMKYPSPASSPAR